MKKGFTLAEVLITLAIIGVVAALTIPSVILNTNQTEYKTGLKKAVSVLNQAVSLELAIDNLSPNESIATSTASGLIHILQKQMNTISAASGACDGGMEVADGVALGDSEDANKGSCSFTTTDGMQYMLISGNPSDTYGGTAVGTGEGYNAFHQNYGGCHTSTTDTETACYMVVDVNGDKNPNKMTINAESPTDRFLIMFKGENGTTVTPAGFGAKVMFGN